MPTRTILSPAQRAAIFDPPADRAMIERLYTLGSEDLAEVTRRRRDPNRIGHAVQICYLLHPGRALLPGEAVPDAMLALFFDLTLADFEDRLREIPARLSLLRISSSVANNPA